MLDPAEHSVLSRIEDTARFVASMVISNMAFMAGGTAPYNREEWRRRTREFTIPQEADRLLSAHSTMEMGNNRHLLSHRWCDLFLSAEQG